MKKIFLLIPALILSLVMNATSTTISPESATSDNNIRAAFNGTADTIYLNPGEYIQESQIHFKRSAVLIAADKSNKPVIILKYYCDLINENSKVFVDGLIFDGSVAGQQAVRPYDATTGKELHFNDCEFYNFAKTAISGDKADCALDSCVVNNCKFINGNRSCIFMQSANLAGVKVTNSTFANITNVSGGDYASPIDVRSASAKVLIDHCTMYNCATIDANYNYINVASTSDVIVSNSIFASAEGYDCCGTYLKAGGLVKNCLTYNLTNWQGDGANMGHVVSGGATITDCLRANPLFNDLTNNKYTIAGDWTTTPPSISPARGAATDGSDLGDPRWYSAETLPSTDFVAPYAFVGAKAQLSGNLWYNSDDAYLYYNNKSTNGTATWKIHAERACAVGVTLNLHAGSPTVHKLRVNILDADGNSVGELSEQASTLPGTIAIPAEGDYTITLNDDQGWTSAQVDNITLAYVGGALVTVPAEELVGTEAVLVNAGKLKVSKLDNGDLKYGDNEYPLQEYVYWNINTTKYGSMKVTANVVFDTEKDETHQSSHQFLVELYSDLNASPISSSAEPAATSATGAVAMPALNIPATGNYIIKLTNQKQWSSAILHSIDLEYAGGEIITVPAEELIGEEAVLVDLGHLKVSKLENGNLKYGDNGNQLDEYVYWNINATRYGRMSVTANVVFDTEKDADHQSSHQFLVELYSDLNASPISSSAEPAATSATGEVAMPALNIPAVGNYIIKLTNQKQWSSAILHSLEFAYAGGEVADVPGQIVAADAMLLKEDGGTLKMYLDENGDIKYNNNGYNLTEYALWNINATEAGEMIVTLNVTHSGHLFTIELYEGETLKSSVAEPDANEWHSGDLELENHLNIPAAGSYTVKLINRQQYSGGAIHGITFTKYIAPAAVVIDEMDEDNSAWIGYKDGDPVNVTLNRTLKAGMYNTFCLPFAVSSTQCKAVFGNDVEIYTLGSAVVEGTVLNVTLDPSDDIYQGTPVFIKPSADVVNPSFEGVSIVKETPAATTKTNANLVGTFVKTTLTGGENILYLGPSNTLYYPEIDTPIKGMRAWFAIHDAPTPAPAIKRMNIVNAPAVVTEINLIDADNKAVKTIENGQLIITIDGVRYNVMGTKIQ